MGQEGRQRRERSQHHALLAAMLPHVQEEQVGLEVKWGLRPRVTICKPCGKLFSLLPCFRNGVALTPPNWQGDTDSQAA